MCRVSIYAIVGVKYFICLMCYGKYFVYAVYSIKYFIKYFIFSL